MSQLVPVQQCLPLDAGRPAALVSRLTGQLIGRRWSIVRLKSERKYGELLGPKEPGKRTDLEPVTACDRSGRMARNRARQVFAVPPEAFDTYLSEADEPTRSELLRTGKQGKLPASQLLGPAETGRPEGNVSSADVVTGPDREARRVARQVFAIPEAAFDTYLSEADEPTRSELLRTGKQGKLPAGQLLGPAMTPQEAGALSRSKGSTGAEYLAQNRARQVAA